MTVTLNFNPEVEAGLMAQAQATGMTLEHYVQKLVEKEVSVEALQGGRAETTGMVWENGILVYRTGRPLPTHLVDNAIQQSREERTRQILGEIF